MSFRVQIMFNFNFIEGNLGKMINKKDAYFN
jgi:hypothetical protein